MDSLFHFDVRHHFAADFAEAAEAVRDAQEAVFINGCDVSGVIPAVLEYFGGFLRSIEVPHHDVRAANEEQPGLVYRQSLAGIRVKNTHCDAGQGMADGPPLRAHLSEVGGAKVIRVDRNHWRAFRATVAFQGPNSEMIFEGLRDAFRQFFRAGHHDAQAAKRLRRAASRVSVQERRRGDRKSTRLNSSHVKISYAVFCLK